jgi:hypothetical protein
MIGKAAVDVGRQFGHAFARGGLGLDHRRTPGALGMQALAQRDHLLQHLHRAVGFLVVGLVHHEDVADLVDAGLGGLHVVAAHRRLQQHHHPAWRMMSVSFWPTPTVSISTMSQGMASSTVSASPVARDSPPRWPREAMLRMKTPASPLWSAMRSGRPARHRPKTGWMDRPPAPRP